VLPPLFVYPSLDKPHPIPRLCVEIVPL